MVEFSTIAIIILIILLIIFFAIIIYLAYRVYTTVCSPCPNCPQCQQCPQPETTTLQNGSIIQLKNTSTNEYLGICSYNSIPVVVASTSQTDPSTQWIAIIQTYNGSNFIALMNRHTGWFLNTIGTEPQIVPSPFCDQHANGLTAFNPPGQTTTLSNIWYTLENFNNVTIRLGRQGQYVGTNVGYTVGSCQNVVCYAGTTSQPLTAGPNTTYALEILY